jgi:hypothetical protein
MRAVFLNLGPPSKVSPAEAAADIRAILATEPDIFVGVEAVAKGKLPSATKLGYVKIKDNSTQGRANLFAYLKATELPHFSFEDMTQDFAREPGRSGRHVPRAYLKFNWRRIGWLLGHEPPGWPGTLAARAEYERRLRSEFARWTDEERWSKLAESTKNRLRNKPRVLLWDRNMPLPAFRKFASSCDAWVVGETVDSAMYRHVSIGDHGYTRVFDGHRIHTDHKRGAFILDLHA